MRQAYPIHIIVKGGRTLLIGAVDSESDKTTAGFRAREVPGTFGVENELVVPQRGSRQASARPAFEASSRSPKPRSVAIIPLS